jgi:Protein of unknown function (DUF1176)
MRSVRLERVGIFLALSCFAGVSYSQLDFKHKEWVLVCDNTRTCRAAGYSVDNADNPASILITRKAGNNSPASVQIRHDPSESVKLEQQAILEVAQFRMRVNGLAKDLPPAQANALISRLIEGDGLSITQGKLESSISLDGIKAVLTKMDDYQGRVGTPSALVAKGFNAKPVAMPMAMPVVQAVALVPDTPIDQKLRQVLVSAIGQHECNNNQSPFEFRRLSQLQILVSRPQCWIAPYNTGGRYWVVESKPRYRVTSIHDDLLNEFFEAESKLRGVQKGRGIGDCLAFREFTWNGKQFVLTSSAWTGPCKGFPGGAWDLPSYVSQVIPAKK